MDMTGSGKADLMLLAAGTLPGYYENEGRQGWGRFVAYPRDKKAAPDWSSGRIRVADNDGDGVIDAIESTSRGFVVRWAARDPRTRSAREGNLGRLVRRSALSQRDGW